MLKMLHISCHMKQASAVPMTQQSQAQQHVITCLLARLLVLCGHDSGVTLPIGCAISFTICLGLAVSILPALSCSVGSVQSSCGTRMGEVGLQLSGQSV